MFKKQIISFLISLFLVPVLALAYISPGEPVGFVNDYADLLTAEQKEALESKIASFEVETSNEIAIVTIESLKGDTVENFAVELFEDWGIGKKDKDNGVLILIAKDERRMRIEVGYGLEAVLTDAQAYEIIDKIMKPAFQAEDYYEGIDRAIEKTIAAIKGEDTTDSSSKQKSLSHIAYLILLFFGFFLLIWLASVLGRSKSWWLGGTMGGVLGSVTASIKGFFHTGLISFLVFIPAGLLFDFIVSKLYEKSKKKGKIPWWIGGQGFGGSTRGSGSSSGFGGGSSGGGGASGGW